MSKNSCWSSFKCNEIRVPRFNVDSFSCVILNDPPALDVHVYCSSSLCLDVTETESATKNAE